MNKKCYKEKILLQKRYFDIGYGTTSYLKIVVGVFGVGKIITGDLIFTGIMIVGYALFCYLFGLLFVKFGWYTADIEITNRFNLFVKEMRKTYKNQKV